MVEFIKNSSNYGLYIVEASIGGDDWLDDHNHIKELDGDLITEGTDGIFLPYVRQIRFTPNYNFNIITFFKGADVNISLGEGYWIWVCDGRFGGTSEATRNTKMGNLTKLMNSHVSLTNNKLYLGYRKIGEVWESFPSETDVKTPYLPGVMLLAEPSRQAQQNFYKWKISFRGIW